jgi:hypothetical protein
VRWGDRLAVGESRAALIGFACLLAAAMPAAAVFYVRRFYWRAAAMTILLMLGAVALVVGWVLRLAPAAVIALDPLTAGNALRDLAIVRGPDELYIAAGAEFGVLLALAIGVSRGLSARICNWCGSPCEIERDVSRRAACDRSEVRGRIEARDWSFFRKLGPPAADAATSLRFDLGSCTCGLTRTVSAIEVRPVMPNVQIVRDVRQTPDDIRTIRAFGLPDDPWYSSAARPVTNEWML